MHFGVCEIELAMSGEIENAPIDMFLSELTQPCLKNVAHTRTHNSMIQKERKL